MAPTLSSKPIVIFVIGGPGSGKGTICERLKNKYGFIHLSTGDLLRDEVSSGSSLGKELNTIMQSGKLVPNEQVLKLLKLAIDKNMTKNNNNSNKNNIFLIDGYPRELNQCKEFEKEIIECKLVLYFYCSDNIMIERLLERGKTSGRIDDNEETIKNRLKIFHKNSDPILDYLQKKLKKIDTNKTIDEVFNDVDNIIKTII